MMPTQKVERIPACPTPYCPTRLRSFKGDKADWHLCFVCQSNHIEHHDAGAGGMGGGRHHKQPECIVALCHQHHEYVTTHVCSDRILDLPGKGRTYVYYNVRGNELCERVLDYGEAGSAGADAGFEKAGHHLVPGPETINRSSSASAPSASPPSPAAEEGLAGQETQVAPVSPSERVPVPEPGLSAAGPSVFAEDWSKLSDDELQLKYDTADQMQGMAFLVKCKSVAAYRDNHVQSWGETWTEHAIERFNVSRRDCYAYANLWEIAANHDTNHIIPLTGSRSLMLTIGRRSLEDGKAAMEVAVAHHAEYAEPPTVSALEHALGEERHRPEKPEVVTLCGSTRFIDAYQDANLRLTLEGKIVLSVGCDTKSDAELFTPEKLAELKPMLDELHLRKIDLSDAILVLNVDGYVGESTGREIEYARQHRKRVDWLEAK